MERDFMGLNSKDSVVVVKEEAVEGCKESVFSKNSPVHWPLSDGFEGSKSRQAGEIQKSIGFSRHGRTHFSMATYPVQQNAFSVQLHNDAKQVVPVTMTNPFFRAQFGGAPVKPHAPFLAGTTEPWYSSKASCVPAQLTIFYGGMVNVYDDISPEKAQAIMFLAGNGGQARVQVQAQAQAQAATPRTPAGDVVYVNTQPGSALSSPMSVSSHPVGIKEEAAKPVSKINSLEQVMQSAAVPQARKASLARFLEKRKERVMAAAPYSGSKGSNGELGSSVVA